MKDSPLLSLLLPPESLPEVGAFSPAEEPPRDGGRGGVWKPETTLPLLSRLPGAEAAEESRWREEDGGGKTTEEEPDSHSVLRQKEIN